MKPSADTPRRRGWTFKQPHPTRVAKRLCREEGYINPPSPYGRGTPLVANRMELGAGNVANRMAHWPSMGTKKEPPLGLRREGALPWGGYKSEMTRQW